MSTQVLERNVTQTPRRRHRPHGSATFDDIQHIDASEPLDILTAELDIDAELRMLTEPSVERIEDRDELGRRIMESAVSPRRESFAVKCRSVAHATDFANPMRSTLLTLSSAFGGISATISPSLNLHTWPAMEMLVTSLEKSGAGELWQPIGERSIGIGAARHIFASADNPIRDESTSAFPTLLVEVVGAHLIDPEWFDHVVAPRCKDEALTFVYYGQIGFHGSLFEREWHESQFQGRI